jgi:hypothetical protein
MTRSDRINLEQQRLNKAILCDTYIYAQIRQYVIDLFGYNTFRYHMLPIACKYATNYYGG